MMNIHDLQSCKMLKITGITINLKKKNGVKPHQDVLRINDKICDTDMFTTDVTDH